MTAGSYRFVRLFLLEKQGDGDSRISTEDIEGICCLEGTTDVDGRIVRTSTNSLSELGACMPDGHVLSCNQEACMILILLRKMSGLISTRWQ